MADNSLKAPLSATLGRHANRVANDHAHPIAKGLPCRVTKIEKDILTIAFEGSNKIWNMPTRKISQAFSPYGRDPTQVGDKGYASPSDYYLGGINKVGGGTANWQARGNLTPLVFHPISKENSETRDYDQLTHAGGPTGVKIIQTAKQPKDDEKPPDQPTPKLMRAMIGWGSAARRAWLARPAPKAAPTPHAEDDRSHMEINKDGDLAHFAKKGKIALRVPADGSKKAWLGGMGKNESLYGAVLVMTPAGPMPSVNVHAKWQKQDDD
jgi:hypothetical protein